ncbi:hypothetical protein COV42_00025 [Candidatus Campbellbacteria bacterium CG11_big_fil_rev_8_21_14_0_20_44_21]|uniref:Uncharacterized protein n=1 Tax=Candidatus Campbellbacteria bacterium CG22_combo_CG10-13_8_21_14_all_43_18 TaxID=1974530 RepID=A0A2H0DVU6_9BACT|nr:MAG: hypothetical protein COW82_02890 [Candidatus Campbellbacteria bacterium CG22_combo_CG10-13_8_21_14_all_43_18]PIR24557.1 MAG: hypothetical protein COV42_00025 [Candidatus Campbellbacteria bacterium CG11_big_fil_rev_8_21_14_0_20_44_21]
MPYNKKWDKGYASKANGNFRSGAFTPKKPVRSFRDLEIYQKTIECAVLISKDIVPHLDGSVKGKGRIKGDEKYIFAERLLDCAMSVPLLVAESHSLRFADFALGVGYLEKAMAGCNKMIVYLEHVKGLYGTKFDMGLLDDIIGRYANARIKMFRLEKSWKKFRTEYADEKTGKGKGDFKYS